MHSGKFITLAASLAINAVALTLLASHSHTPPPRAAAIPVRTHAVITLPTITVYPSAAEWQRLHAEMKQRV